MSLLRQPHHDGSALFVPDQAPGLGDQVSVFVVTPAGAAVDSLYVRSTADGEPRFTAATVDRVAGTGTWWRAELQLRNPVTGYRFLLLGPGGPRWLNAAGVFGHDVPDATDFRLLAWDPPPGWPADAIVYEIFPDRFARSGPPLPPGDLPDWAIACDWGTPVIGRGPQTPYQFYGGDLDGITAHLDHIEALGADTVYLTPIFPARSNHRYDAAAFDRVDPLLGGDEALARLAAAAHERGMRVIGDITTNHCGDAHPWFTAAQADPAAPEREMFYFTEDGGYESWLGVSSLPKLNWRSQLLRERFAGAGPKESVVGRWLAPPYRLDGWRVDVANMTGRHGADDLTREVAALLRQAVAAQRPDALLVAEHAHDASGDLDRDGWHGTMNYAGFTRPLWSFLRSDGLDLPDFLGVPGGVYRRGAAEVAATMRAFAATMSWRSLTNSWTMLGSHDTPRIRTVVGDAARGEVALGLQLGYPGVPMLFAGDEFGLTGSNGEDARRPMPWGAATLPYYRELMGLRRSSPALRHGGLRWAHADGDALAFIRETRDERLLVYARRSAGPAVRIDAVGATEAANVYGGAPARVDDDGALIVPGDGPTVQVWRLA